jgi:hypothetical protein
MFIRLFAIAERVDSLESVFTFELTPQPMSLFKNGLMRKPDKPSLLKALIPQSKTTQTTINEIETCTATVVDGGALLHRVRWLKGMSFESVANKYALYVKRHYKNAVIVLVSSLKKDLLVYVKLVKVIIPFA